MYNVISVLVHINNTPILQMNEKIKELWNNAAESTAAFPSGQNNSWETQVNFMEKFAELIVQECAKQSLYIGKYNTPSNTTPDLAIAIAVGLKKHFGVSE